MQAGSSHKASPHLTPGDSAQAHASAETSAITTASQSPIVQKQLPQAPANISLSEGVQHESHLLDDQNDSSPAVKSRAAAGACNSDLPQQDPAEPAQAGSVVSAGSAREDLLAALAWIDQALSSQTRAQEIVTNPTCLEAIKLVQPASSPPVLQEDTCVQPPQPAEPPQVCLLAPAFTLMPTS